MTLNKAEERSSPEQPLRAPSPKGRSKACASLRRISERLTPFNFAVPDSYDYGKATNVSYNQAPSRKAWGPFKAIRESLDHEWHGSYIESRQQLQDILITDVVGGGTAKRYAPWIVFSGGAMGAGKSRVVSWLSSKGIFPLTDIVQIDPDAFRERLPEWKGYLANDPASAGMLTHRECGYCVEIATEAALQQRKHIWVDGSLRDHKWYAGVFDDIRQRHPHYRVAILYVYAEEASTLQRAARRATLTGRVVAEEILLASMRQVPASIDALAEKADFIAWIENPDDGTPKLRKICDEHVCRFLSGHDWDEVKSRFGSFWDFARGRERHHLWGKLDSYLSAGALARGQREGELEGSSSSRPRSEDNEDGGVPSGVRVTIFGKSYCSFSVAAVAAIEDAGIALQVIQCDKEVLGLEMQAAIGIVTGHTTSPQVFIAGDACQALGRRRQNLGEGWRGGSGKEQWQGPARRERGS